MSLVEARLTFTHAMIITRRELRDQLRDWRIIAPVIGLTLFFPLLMNFTAGQLVAFVEKYGANIIGERLIPFLLMVVGFFPVSVALVIALESFVGEKERHSLEPLLDSPLTDLELYLGKVSAAMLPPLGAAYMGIGVYLTGLAWSLGWYPSPTLLAQILALTTVHGVVMVSGAVVISAQTTSVRAANLLASFVIIPFALLIQGEAMIMFWGQYHVLWWVLVGLVFLAVVLVRMGVNMFNREELLGHDIDELNLKLAWATFRTAFVGRARGQGVGGWYRREVFPTLRGLKFPLAILALYLGVAIVVGYTQAPNYPLPMQIFNMRAVVEDFGARLAEFGFFSPAGAGWILFHNLRAILIATLLGVFSLGVLAVIALMLPLVLVGYFAGQVAAAGISPLLFVLGFVVPHGLVEVPTAIIAGAVILRLGASVLAPPPGRTLSDSWVLALADWAKIFLGLVVPLLAIAAIIEAVVTPRVVLALFGG